MPENKKAMPNNKRRTYYMLRRTLMPWRVEGGNKLPLFVEGGAQMLPVRTDYDDYTMVSVANLASDMWGKITLTVSEREAPFSKIEVLSIDGRWENIPVKTKIRRKGHLKVTLPIQLEPLGVISICFNIR